MADGILTFVFVVLSISLVRAEVGDSEAKTTSKRGTRGLTGIPGVLYSQYSPHVHTVPVPQPFPVPVPHPVPVQVPRPFPVTVHKPVGLPVPVGVPVPVQVPVPRPYPVPVPVNLPHGSTGYGGYSGYGGVFGQDAAYPGTYAGASLVDGFAGRLGYGLGVYGSGSPSLPVAHPGLAAALAALASSPLPHPGVPPTHPDPLAYSPSKY